MARSYATVGQMLTYAVDRSMSSPDLEASAEQHTRVEVILQHARIRPDVPAQP